MKLSFLIAGLVVFLVGIVLFFAESAWGLLLALIGTMATAIAAREIVRGRRGLKR